MSSPQRASSPEPARRRGDPQRSIFINYRREDSGGQARALLYALERSFRDQVFMDVKGLEPGVNYLEEIERTVGSCRAVLVLIGRSWASCNDAAGRRRLDDPRDVVALEIGAALARREVLVIPVLVAGATLPAEEELPEAMRGLLQRQCIQLTEQDWDYNVSQLVETLRRKLAPGRPRMPKAALYAGAAAAAVALAAGGVLLLRRERVPSLPVTATATAPRPSGASGGSPGPAAPAPPPPAATGLAAPGVPPPAVAPSTGGASAAAPTAVAAPATRAREAIERVPTPVAEAKRARPKPAEASSTRPATRPPPVASAAARPPEPPPRSVPADSAPPLSAGTPGDAVARTPPAVAAPAPRREVYVSREVLGFQQLFGDPALKERGRRLVQPARLTLEPSGALTFTTGEEMPGFFPMTVPATRSADRVTFQGVRTAKTGDGQAYVRLSGQVAPHQSPPVLTLDIEIGRVTGTEPSEWEPTYRARARVRVSAE